MVENMVDASQINLSVVINVVMGIIATSASIIAYFAKKHYADMDKKIEENSGDIRLLVERAHQLAVNQARGENLAVTISELKSDIKDLQKSIHDLNIQMSRTSITDLRHIK